MKNLYLLLMLISHHSYATLNIEECISWNGDIGNAMLFVMLDDLLVDRATVDEEKTDVKIIRSSLVNFPLAIVYGNKEKELSGINSDDPTTASEYAEGFMRDRTKNFILEYNLINKKGKKNTFLASAFISEAECIVRFNGYIIVKREF